jgi:hypothetical protein
VAVAAELCSDIAREFPQSVFFAGKLIFERERWYQRLPQRDRLSAAPAPSRVSMLWCSRCGNGGRMINRVMVVGVVIVLWDTVAWTGGDGDGWWRLSAAERLRVFANTSPATRDLCR